MRHRETRREPRSALALLIVLALAFAAPLAAAKGGESKGKGGGAPDGGHGGGNAGDPKPSGGGSQGDAKKDGGEKAPPSSGATPPANASQQDKSANSTRDDGAKKGDHPNATKENAPRGDAVDKSEKGGKADKRAERERNATNATKRGEKKEKDNATAADGRGRGGPPRDAAIPPGLALEKASTPPSTASSTTNGTPSRSGDAPPRLVIEPESGSAATGAHGRVRLMVENLPPRGNFTLVLVAPDGSERVLARGTNEAEWNTSGESDGPWRVEGRETNESGGTFTVASAEIIVANPVATPIATAVALATGAFLAAAGSVAAAGAASSAASAGGASALATVTTQSAAPSVGLSQYAKDAASDLAQDRFKDRTAHLFAFASLRRTPPLAAAAIAVVFLAVFFTFASARGSGLHGFLAVLPIVGAAALVYTAAKHVVESWLARASGAHAHFRLHAPGAVSLALSSVLLGAPFGTPGYVHAEEAHDEPTAAKRATGARALGALGIGAALALPFVLAGEFWRMDFAQAGLTIALTSVATSALPFRPLAGSEVWAWNKPLALLAAAVGALLYFAFMLALLPMSVVLAISLGGLGLAAWAVGEVRKTRARRRVGDIEEGPV